MGRTFQLIELEDFDARVQPFNFIIFGKAL